MTRVNRIPKWVWLFVIIFSVTTVWVRLAVVRLSYQVEQTNTMVSNARRDLDRKTIELENLKSLERLEILAKKKFDLERPTSDQIVVIGGNSEK